MTGFDYVTEVATPKTDKKTSKMGVLFIASCRSANFVIFNKTVVSLNCPPSLLSIVLHAVDPVRIVNRLILTRNRENWVKNSMR
jgi:hypothetical protein